MENQREIFLGNEKFISLKEASDVSGYAKDYVGYLCRTQKVPAKRFGRDWFVSESALISYKRGDEIAQKDVEKNISENIVSNLIDNVPIAPTLKIFDPKNFALTAATIFVALSFGVAVAGSFDLRLPRAIGGAQLAALPTPFIKVTDAFGEMLFKFFYNQPSINYTLQKKSITATTTPIDLSAIKSQIVSELSGKGLVTNTIVEKPTIIERAVERVISGISQSDLDAQLNIINNKLLSQVADIKNLIATRSDQNFSAIALTNKIDNLSGTSLSNVSFSGSVSGLTDAHIPDNITASNYMPLAGGTWQGSTIGVSYGGTGITAYTTGDILYADSATTLTKLPAGTAGQVLKIASGLPSWSTDLMGSGGAGAWATTTDSLALYPATITNVVIVGNNATTSTGNIFEVTGQSYFNGKVGIGTSSPYTKLSVVGQVVGEYFTATSTTATSTFPYLSATQSNLGTIIGGTWQGTVVSPTYGGTGWGNLQANTLLLGNGTGQIATTTAGTNGQILVLASGVPTWTSTSTASASQFGFLSANDWTLFNEKVASSSLSSFVTGPFASSTFPTFTYASTSFVSLPYASSTYLNLADFYATTTKDIAEETNLYWTTTRFDNRLSATTTLPNLTTLLGLQNATTSLLTISNLASTSQLIVSNSFTFANLSGFLKATAGVVSTSLVNLASDITGILPMANGGTGWANLQANTLLLGNGTGAIATTTAGTNGQVLALVSGVPTWQSTTTLSTISGILPTAKGGTGQDFSSASGLINLYSGTASAIATSSLGLLTTNVAEGVNLYWTNDRFDNRLSATTTLPNLTTLLGLTNASTSLLTVSTLASTTNLIVSATTTTLGLNVTGTATSTFANGLNLSAGCFSVNGTCITSGGSGGAFAWTPTTNYGALTNATNTPIWLQQGLQASSTSYFANASTSLLTVTGRAWFNSSTTFNGIEYLFPNADGSNNQVLATNGAGGLSWVAQTGSGGTFAWTPTTSYGALTNSTNTPIWFQQGLQASSTSYFANATSTQLTVTGPAYFNSTTRMNGVTYSWPSADGGNGQYLATNGAGTLAWSSTTPGTSITPSFYAHRNGSGTSTGFDGLPIKMVWTAERYDTNNNFNLTTSRFQPTVAGKYLVHAQAGFQPPSGNLFSVIYIYKNGSAYNYQQTVYTGTSNTWIFSPITVVVDMNGTTDYLEVYLNTNTNNISVIGDSSTFFTGSRLDGGSNWTDNGATTYLATLDNAAVGTSTAYSKLSVWATSSVPSVFSAIDTASTTLFTIMNTGNVGIGTTSPYAKLSVVGQVVGEYFTATSTTATSSIAGIFSVGSTTPASNALFSVGTSTTKLIVDKVTGFLGLGTTTPTEQLSTSGRLYVGGAGTSTIENNLAVLGALKVGTGSIYLNGNSTSTFSAGIETPYLNITGTSATSTLANGLNLSAGCFSVNGVCVSGTGGGSGGGQLLAVYATSTPGSNVSVNFNGASGSAPSFSGGVLTLPSNTSYIIVEEWGGGGGGGGSGGINSGASGGSGGGYSQKLISNLASTYYYTVGRGGASGVGGDGGTASTTCFGTNTTINYCADSTFYATGGIGGRSINPLVGGYGSGGDINLNGRPSSPGVDFDETLNTFAGGNGGSAPLGGSGGAGYYNIDGDPGLAPGGGGGGGGYYTTAKNGGNGASGGIVIRVYTTGISNGSLASGIAGQFAYYNAAGTNLSATSDLFHATNGNIGIGTTSPYSKLTVWATSSVPSVFSAIDTASTTLFTIMNGGNVGIGTTSPYAKLSVVGQTVAEYFTATSTTATSTFMGALGVGTSTPVEKLSTSGRLYVGGAGTSTIENNLAVLGTLKVGTGSIYLNGNSTSTFSNAVGVGTTSPLSKLDVYGDLIISGASRYLNFGDTAGTNGYGLRDNAGTLQFKHSAGSWADVGSGGAFAWTPTTNYGALTNSTNTPIWFKQGLQASSTSHFANATTSQLTVTGQSYFNSTTTFNGVPYLFPNADGTNGKILTTNGAGGLSWATPSSGITPSFHVSTSTVATMPVAWTKINFATEEFDSNNNYDTTTYRFTPTVAGKYIFAASVYWWPTNLDQAVYVTAIYKNGVNACNVANTGSGTGDTSSSVTCILEANGTDYFEVYAYHDSGTGGFIGGSSGTYFTGSRLDGGSNWTDNGATTYLATGDNAAVGTSTAYSKLSVWATSTMPSVFSAVDTASTTLFTIMNSGYVGIGTTTPSAFIHIEGTTADIKLSNTQAGGGTFRLNSGVEGSNRAFAIQDSSAGNATRFLIDSNGNVGVGTSSPYAKLSVVGQVVGEYFTATSTTATSSANLFSVGSTTPASNALFSVGTSTPRLVIDKTTGNVTIGTSASSGETLDVLGSFAVENPAGTDNFIVGRDGRVGISSTTPWAKLSIHALSTDTDQISPLFAISSTTPTGFASTTLIVTRDGRVGIGTSNVVLDNANTFVPSFIVSNTANNASIQVNRWGNPGAQGAAIILSTNRGTDSNTYTALQNGDGIGNLRFSGASGSTYNNAASIVSQVDGAVAPGYVPGNLIFNASSTERMRITAAGNVGVGTSTPLYPLTVQTSTGANGIAIMGRATNNVSTLAFYNNQSTTLAGYLQGSSNIGLEIAQGSATDIIISTSGTVGISTSSPASNHKLYVRGLSTSSANYGLVIQDLATADNMWVRDDGAGYLRAAAWSYGSDRRMKENINYIDSGGLEKIWQLRPARFDYISGEANQLGFIAQDVQGVIPEAVVVTNATTGMLGLKTDFVVPYLVKALQETVAILDIRNAATSSQTLLSYYSATGTPAIYVDAFGNIGIGTTSPNYKLTVQGEVAAQGFVNISTKNAKKDIVYLNASDEDSALEKIVSTNLATYNYLSDHRSETSVVGQDCYHRSETSVVESEVNCRLRLGLIAEEAPIEVLSVDGKGVDLYKMTSFAWLGLKAQEKKLDAMELRLAELEKQWQYTKGATSTNTLPDAWGNNGGVLAAVVSAFRDIGITFTNGLIQTREFLAEKITAKKVVAEVLEMKDSVTNEVYCLKISNGEWSKSKGECAENNNTVASPNSTTTSHAAVEIIIIGNNPATIQVGDIYGDLGATASTTDQSIIALGIRTFQNGAEVSTPTINTSTVGTYEIVYKIIDGDANVIAEATRTVIIETNDKQLTTDNGTATTTDQTTTSTDAATTTTTTAI